MAELRTIVITETFKVDDILTDLDAVPNFTDENAAESGIIRLQDNTVVVAADTALAKSATGTYTYSFTESPNSYTYGYWIKWVYDSTTYYDYHTKAGGSAAITTKTAYKNYTGITSTDDDALLDQLVLRATSAMESFCDRKFQHNTYRERYNGTDDTELYLRQYPVTEIKMLSIGTTDVIRFKNTSTDAYNAYVRVNVDSMILTIQGGNDDGSTTLTLTDYTITTLEAKIESLTGWTSEVITSEYGIWNAEEILPVSGLECHDSYASIQCPDEPEYSFKTDNNKGSIYLSSGFPTGYQNVIVSYAAGYAAMPDDLIQICLDLVNVYYKSRKTDSTVAAEKLGDHYIKYSDEGGGGARDIPTHIQKRLAPYRKWRLSV